MSLFSSLIGKYESCDPQAQKRQSTRLRDLPGLSCDTQPIISAGPWVYLNAFRLLSIGRSRDNQNETRKNLIQNYIPYKKCVYVASEGRNQANIVNCITFRKGKLEAGKLSSPHVAIL